jgi:hypothetical protein
MYKIVDLLFNFNTGKKINLKRDIAWGFIAFFLIFALIKLIA